MRISQEWLHGLCKLNEEEVKRTRTHTRQTNSNCYAANHRPFLPDKCVTSVDWHVSLICSLSHNLSIFSVFTRPKEYVEVPGAFRQQPGFLILFAWGEKLGINPRFTMGETHRRSIWGPLVVWGLTTWIEKRLRHAGGFSKKTHVPSETSLGNYKRPKRNWTLIWEAVALVNDWKKGCMSEPNYTRMWLSLIHRLEKHGFMSHKVKYSEMIINSVQIF